MKKVKTIVMVVLFIAASTQMFSYYEDLIDRVKMSMRQYDYPLLKDPTLSSGDVAYYMQTDDGVIFGFVGEFTIFKLRADAYVNYRSVYDYVEIYSRYMNVDFDFATFVINTALPILIAEGYDSSVNQPYIIGYGTDNFYLNVFYDPAQNIFIALRVKQ